MVKKAKMVKYTPPDVDLSEVPTPDPLGKQFGKYGFINTGDLPVSPSWAKPFIEPDAPEVLWSDVLLAAFTLENPQFGAYSRYLDIPEIDSLDIPENFNPIENIQGYEEYKDILARAETPLEVAVIKNNIDKQRSSKKVLNEGGWKATASMLAAGSLDLVNLIPFGATAKALKGGSLLRRGLITAGSSASGLTVSEAILHSQQETRTLGESAANIAVGTLLAGVLGTGIAHWKDVKTGKISQDLIDSTERNLIIPEAGKDYAGGDKLVVQMGSFEFSLSAGAAVPESVEFQLKKAFGLEKLPASGVIRCATSPNPETVKALLSLVDTGLIYLDKAGNRVHVPSAPISTVVSMLQRKFNFRSLEATKDAFTSYRIRENNLPQNQRSVVRDVYGVPINEGKVLTRKQFNEEIYHSLLDRQEHAIPEVRQAAEKLRQVFNDVTEIGIESKLFPEDLRAQLADTNYVPRAYDHAAIKANREGFKEAIKRELRSNQTDIFLDDADLNMAAEQIINNILSTPDGRMHVGAHNVQVRGSMHERVLDIASEDISQFLIKDVDELAKRYTNTVVADSVMMSVDGTLDGSNMIRRVSETWNKHIGKITPEDPHLGARREALLKQELADHHAAIAKTEDPAIKDLLERRHALNKEFIKTATPDEVLARRKEIAREKAAFTRKANEIRKSELAKLSKALDPQLSPKKLNLGKEAKALPSTKGDETYLSASHKKRMDKLEAEHNAKMDSLYAEKSAMGRKIEVINQRREASLATLRKEDPNYNARKTEIENQANADIANLQTTDPNALKKIRQAEKRRDADIRDITAMVDMIRGTLQQNNNTILNAFQLPKLIKGLKGYNHIRSMGQAMLSSIPDLAAFIHVHGLNRTIGDMVIPFIQNLHRMIYRFFGSRLAKLAGKDFHLPRNVYEEALQEIRDWGIGCDITFHNSRANNLSGMSETFGDSRINRWIDKHAQYSTYYSGQAGWNQGVGVRAGYMASSSLISLARRVAEGGYISTKKMNFLKQYGVTDKMLVEFAEQFKKFGKEEGGVVIAGTKGWSNRQAAFDFEVACNRITDNTILNPSLEKPLFFSTPIGGLMGQFKSFAFGANQRYLMAGLQRMEAESLAAAATAVGLGIAQRAVKDIISQGELKERSTIEWIKIGVDASGITGIIPEIESYAEAATSGVFNVENLLSGKVEKRYGGSERGLKALSPSFGLLADASQAFGGALSSAFQGRPLNSTELGAARRIGPYQNNLVFRKGYDFVEDNLRDRWGLRTRSS